MSGGSYDYAYTKVLDFTEALEDSDKGETPKTLLRAAFIRHLRTVAEAMRAIEWEDSGDGADDNGAMMAVMLDYLPSDEALTEGFKARIKRIRGYVKDIRKEKAHRLWDHFKASVNRGWPRSQMDVSDIQKDIRALIEEKDK